MNLRDLVANSLRTELTWCEAHRAAPFQSGWRLDPFLVLIIPLDTAYTLKVEPSGEAIKTYRAQPGELLIAPPGIRHAFEADTCTIRGINVKYSVFGGIDLISFYTLPNLLTGEIATQAREVIESLVGISGRRSTLYPVPQSNQEMELDLSSIVAERCLLLQLLKLILAYSRPNPRGGTRLSDLSRVQPALGIIHDRLLDEVPVDFLSNACGLSERRFRTVFKQAVGRAPHQYRLGKRIELAMKMLMTPELSVTEIANQLRFHDLSHFTKTFKRECGLSPQFYRMDLKRKIGR
ncbi:hypothetical protein CWI75_15355 [Kineobactrum sediminis]|uniref:HTH araC/xylS-type domain-containing protein n=1 Tax=Kineobactrum sediminis TaxID=1905677 RepID=A0A2N5XZ42_9GAMM|nr:AraC family transcriptional regulator [Kineobactrum sediminis]PLW81407.1 hypothetical protein CWI75_15355 [Kineobactrum sediminis]